MKHPWTLLISPVVPDAQGTGIHRRAWMWATALSRSQDLITLAVSPSTDLGVVSGLPGRLITMMPDAGSTRWWRRYTWRVAVPSAFQAVLRDLPDYPPTRVMVFRLDVLPVINWLPKHWLDQLDIDLDDWESKKYLGFIWMALQHYRWRESASYLQFYALSRVMERAAVSLARVIHIAAEEDAAAFTRIHPRAKLNIAPNQIAPLTSDSSNSCPTKAEALLFVGNLRYLPNSDAIYWAIQKMLPRLRQTHPNVTLYVVGDASADLAQFLGNAPVKWAGRLDDLSDIYAQSTIAIAPLRGGSGTKFKILEAWLYRRAVVATTHAARGLGIVPGVHALVADTVEDFVSACQQLLDDEGLRNKIANAGHQLVHEKFVL